jgi:predicted transposase/invertase (TIGR01784 family)
MTYTIERILDRELKKTRKAGLEQGREEERALGRKIGAEENSRKIAKRLLDIGMSVEQIAQITDLSTEIILELE